MKDDSENVASCVEDFLEYSDVYEIALIGEASEVADFFAFLDENGDVHRFTNKAQAAEAATRARITP